MLLPVFRAVRPLAPIVCVASLLLLCVPLLLFAAPEAYELRNAPAQTSPERPLVLLPDGRAVDPFVLVPEGWIRGKDGALLTEEGLIVRPDGRVETPFADLPEGTVKRPDGTLVTPEGLVIAPKGSVVHEKVRGKKRDILASYPAGSTLLPDGTVRLPDGTKILADGTKILPDGTRVRKDGTKILPDGTTILPDGTKVVAKKTPVVSGPSGPSSPSSPSVTGGPLWSMLPLTRVEGREPAVQDTAKEKKDEVQKKAQEKPREKPKEQPKEKPKEQKKAAKEPENAPEKPRAKPRMGEQLRIPPEAVTSGSLAFLEGCWEGTRPEYFSKRTIKECFCFGKNGGVGKRRVFDPLEHRRCVGGTKASLSKNGVLSVSSQGAVCSDGERWGRAEMTCRGHGQSTPCSWVFSDAQGGRQSYAIPFVRVQSCGRR